MNLIIERDPEIYQALVQRMKPRRLDTYIVNSLEGGLSALAASEYEAVLIGAHPNKGVESLVQICFQLAPRTRIILIGGTPADKLASYSHTLGMQNIVPSVSQYQ